MPRWRMDDALRRLLDQLCARHGVLTEYRDVWGQRHAPRPEALVKLLGELGFDAASPQALAAALRSAEAAREVVPPLHAVEAGAPQWSIPVQLAAPTGTLRWRVVEEGGAEHRGETSPAGVDGASHALKIALALPAGYHRFHLDGCEAVTQLVAAPARCYQPPTLAGDGRTWGPALQLYGLRSERNWGIGDFGDLAIVIEQWSERGAGLVGLNPLHALFTHNPWHLSPYSPSSRLQLNTLYLDVAAVADLHECEAAQALLASADFQQRLAALRAAPTVDYAGVAAAKHEVLRLLYRSFRERHLAPRSDGGGGRAAEFRRFQLQRSPALRLHAGYEALQMHFHAQDASVWGWPVWPAAYRDPGSPEVARFFAEHEHEVEYFEYLQWQADVQLARLARRCRERGMAVGLYLDLAVSVDRAGSDTWSHQAAYATGATVG